MRQTPSTWIFHFDGASFALKVTPPFTTGRKTTKVTHTQCKMPPVALQHRPTAQECRSHQRGQNCTRSVSLPRYSLYTEHHTSSSSSQTDNSRRLHTHNFWFLHCLRSSRRRRHRIADLRHRSIYGAKSGGEKEGGGFVRENGSLWLRNQLLRPRQAPTVGARL